MPPPGPDLAVPFAGEGRGRQDAPNMVHPLTPRTGAKGAPSGSQCRALVPLPVDGGACHVPHAADPRQAIRLARGGRGGRAHRLDLPGGQGGRVTAGRPLPPAAAVTRPPSCAARKTARASSTHFGSPLQSLCELLARGPLWKSRVHSSGHLL